MRVLNLILVIFLIAGCTASYQVNSLSGAADTHRLDKHKIVYIAIPQDGAYESRLYYGSGQTVAQTVATAFSRVATRVHIAEKQLTNEETIDFARKLGAGYVAVPTIAHWEQRATEWSGRPSKMAIRVTIFDAISGNQISSTSIEGRSRIMSFTSTSPESLLKDPLAQYVNNLY